MKVTKNSTIINKLQKVLDKKYGEFGRIIIREDEKGIIEVIFEENDYLYIALNCYNVAMCDEVDEVIDKMDEALNPAALLGTADSMNFGSLAEIVPTVLEYLGK